MALKPPQYPFEALTRPTKSKNVVNIPHKGALRSHRVHGYAHPPVVSSTQQLLCLTPSKSGIISLRKDLARNVRDLAGSSKERSTWSDVGADISVKRFNESKLISDRNSVISRSKILEKSDIFRTIRNRTTSNIQSFTPTNEVQVSHFNPLYTTVVKKEKESHPQMTPKSAKFYWDYKNRQKSNAINERTNLHQPRTMTSLSTSRKDEVTYGKAKWPVFQLTNNIQRYQVNFQEEHHTALNQSRKMAPVLRVLPALPNSRQQSHDYHSTKATDGDTKRVRFMDQIGKPLIRPATPNYKRKHSYILRWLETAGKPPKNLQML